MIQVVPYKAEHLRAIQVQDALLYASEWMDSYAEALERTFALSVLHNGAVMVCSGLVEMWPGRALLWSFFDHRAGRCMTALVRAARKVLDESQYRRIEMDVDCEFAEAHRLAALLGFKLECERRVAYRRDGGDSALYVRIKNG
jgi:hypothetical protein